MTRAELQAQADAHGPWFYEFDFGQGVRTVPAIPPEVVPIHETRREMMERAIRAHFGERLRQVDCLDIGCHEGYYTVAAARLGVRQVLGVDVREESLVKAQFVTQTLGLTNTRFQYGNCEEMDAVNPGVFDLTLFLGVLYHLENPMRCLRNLAAITREMCVVETQVVAEVEGHAEWGAHAWTRPYQGILAVIDETGEYNAGNRETGASPIATCPSPKALVFLLHQAGFKRVEFVSPPPGAYEQHARGQRVVCAAYK